MIELIRRIAKAAVRKYDRAAATLCPTALAIGAVPTAKGCAALTFDGGPDELTGEILDVLDQFGSHATFFLYGVLAARDPALVDRIVRSGHQVGVLSWSQGSATDSRSMRCDLLATTLTLPLQRLRMLRRRADMSFSERFTAWREGYCLVGRSERPGDVAGDAAVFLARYFRQLIRDGDIVAFDAPRATTAAALPYLLASLESRNMRSVTVPELIGAR